MNDDTEQEHEEEGIERTLAIVHSSDDLIQEYIREIEERELSREDTNICLKK